MIKVQQLLCVTVSEEQKGKMDKKLAKNWKPAVSAFFTSAHEAIHFATPAEVSSHDI